MALPVEGAEEEPEGHLTPIQPHKDATGCIRGSEKTSSRQLVNRGKEAKSR